MSQLKQILLLFAQGHSIKGIVRETGISPNTIKGYLRAIKSREINLEEAINMDELRVEHLSRSPLRKEKQRPKDIINELQKIYPNPTVSIYCRSYNNILPCHYAFQNYRRYIPYRCASFLPFGLV